VASLLTPVSGDPPPAAKAEAGVSGDPGSAVDAALEAALALAPPPPPDRGVADMAEVLGEPLGTWP
jgi:hypothetical protein